MRKELKDFLKRKLQEVTGLEPKFNAHELSRQLTKDVLFVRLDRVNTEIESDVSEVTFEVYYFTKVVDNSQDVQDKQMDIAEKISSLNGFADIVTDKQGYEQDVVIWVVSENYSEDYTENVGVEAEVQFEIVLHVTNF